MIPLRVQAGYSAVATEEVFSDILESDDLYVKLLGVVRDLGPTPQAAESARRVVETDCADLLTYFNDKSLESSVKDLLSKVDWLYIADLLSYDLEDFND